jgi:CRISPR system Cascade subunit CasD
VTTLLMRLSGPMQSWGIHSRYDERDTGFEPSKSGVIGLLCAASGVARNDTKRIAEMAQLDMAVRVDREGKLESDYQTAGGGNWPGRRRYGVIRADGSLSGTGSVESRRYYLADADFLVAMGGSRDLLEQLYEALRNPVWPLYLGRRGYVASRPIWLPDGFVDTEPVDSLKSYPWRPLPRWEKLDRVRLVVECGPEDGQRRLDVPVNFEQGQRVFAPRYVKSLWISVAELPLAKEVDNQCICRD